MKQRFLLNQILNGLGTNNPWQEGNGWMYLTEFRFYLMKQCTTF